MKPMRTIEIIGPFERRAVRYRPPTRAVTIAMEIPVVTDAKNLTRSARLWREVRSVLWIFAYLALILGSLASYQRLILSEHNISFFHYGYAVFEALVLAKVIVIGRYMKLGDRYNDKPLIVPVLFKTLWFGVLILAFALLEHLLRGWWHGVGPAVVFREILSRHKLEIAAQVQVLMTALAPLFAIQETSRVLGEGKLQDLFFHRRIQSP